MADIFNNAIFGKHQYMYLIDRKVYIYFQNVYYACDNRNEHMYTIRRLLSIELHHDVCIYEHMFYFLYNYV